MSFYPTVKDLLAVNAARSSGEFALIDPQKGVFLTYAELERQAMALSSFLTQQGIEQGDRVALFLTDAIEFPVSLFAIAQIGAVFVPINYRISARELKYILEDSQPRALIFDREGSKIVEELKDRVLSIKIYLCTGEEKLDFADSFGGVVSKADRIHVDVKVFEEDVACILYTSGTTGRPKGVVYSHRGFLTSGKAWTHAAKITPLDRSIALGPLYHVGGMLANFMPTFYMGGSNVILKHFDPSKVLSWIKEFNITVMWATPTHINMMISTEGVKDFDVSSLRVIQYSGAPIHLALLKKVRSIFGNIALINAYGATELVAVSCVYPEEHDDHLGSVGRAMPETFVRLVQPGKSDLTAEVKKGEVGEIIVRSPCLMKGYWNLPDKTGEAIKDGWYFTGDLGKIDEGNYIYFVEREDDMIISGGENIYPLEVEEVISSYEKVGSIAVVGTLHEKWGEVVTAFVVKANEAVTAEELDQYCLNSDKLSRFKRPRRYIFVEELPTTSSGKVDKLALRRHELLKKAPAEKSETC
jgi:fatty-acyl-CoA synthase